MTSHEPTWDQFMCLHPHVVRQFRLNKLSHPTKIQTEVFSHYKNYYDFLIASQTGSGKTYCFAAPIVSELITLAQNHQALPQCILCLILTPTRQLAQQIQSNIKMITQNTSIKVGSIVGGLSKFKQARILKNVKPQIIVATPGRLNELLQEQLLTLENVKFLVIDEADRMIQMGHFVQIDNILNKVFNPVLKEIYDDDFHQAKRALEQKQKDQQYYIKDQKTGKKIKLNFSLNSFQTDKLYEVPLNMFKIYDPNEGLEENKPKKQKKIQIKPIESVMENQQMGQNGDGLYSIEKLTEQQKSILLSMKRRIFFISATLTREFKGTKYFFKKNEKEMEQLEFDFKDKQIKKDKKNKYSKDGIKKDQGKNNSKNKIGKNVEDDQGYIPKLKALMSRVQFSGKPKIIDLSLTLFLPEKLNQMVCFCDDDLEKISIVLCYIQTLPSNSKIIIFANTIKSSKRVQFFVQSFKHRVLTLHSHMQQKQRLKKLERFKNTQQKTVLIATDVAARGLDFVISNVVQYNIPVNGDTYVHRIGRTARANKSGQSLTMIDRKESDRWNEISESIGERKVGKYLPQQNTLDGMKQKVNNFEWIRRNQEKLQQKKHQEMDKIQAEEIGVQLDDKYVSTKNRVNKEEEIMNKNFLKRQIKEVKKGINSYEAKNNEETKWKKNKLIMTIDDIRKYL